MKKLSLKLVLATLAMALVASCSKEEFAADKQGVNAAPPSISKATVQSCVGRTLERPPVDILFLWDNTSSQNFVTTETKTALNNTIYSVSQEFDYHIMVAPLVASGNTDAFLISLNTNGLTSQATSIRVPPENAGNRLNNFSSTSGGAERGLERAVEMLQNNHGNGIFREKAHTIVVVMSNGNDFKTTTNGQYDTDATNAYISQQKNALVSIRDNLLDANQLRFLSMVAFSACRSGYLEGSSYIRMSQLMNDSTDAYDICNSSFTFVFKEINDSIRAVLKKHVYDAWPITGNQSVSIDPEKIKVTKSNGQEYFPVEGPGEGPGFKYLGNVTRNTRLLPTPGEPATGHLIELYDSAKVTYPECLIIQTQTPLDYFGYVVLPTKPVVSSIQLKIKGALIPQSTTNGWEYIGYSANQNIKITAVDDHTAALPAVNKSGHVLKMHGSAVYDNNTIPSVIYDPSK